MIIVKAPLRISLVGGGTDIPTFYNSYGHGAVVNFAIDKYVYVIVNPKFDDGIRISYAETENVELVGGIRHSLVRESLKLMDIEKGIEIVSVADVPGKGTGLGSSSSFTVALLDALCQYKELYYHPPTSQPVDTQRLAELACLVEIEKCHYPIGKQDQYAAAYGGINFLSFTQDAVAVTSISQSIGRKLQKKLLLFYTGKTRSATPILLNQGLKMKTDPDTVDRMVQMAYLAERVRDDFEDGIIKNMGKYLHENWMMKKKLSDGITSDEIDRWYQAALGAGAEGGKLCGAGGGGFMLFYADEDRHDAIKKAVGLRHIPFQIDPRGSRIVYMEGLTHE